MQQSIPSSKDFVPLINFDPEASRSDCFNGLKRISLFLRCRENRVDKICCFHLILTALR